MGVIPFPSVNISWQRHSRLRHGFLLAVVWVLIAQAGLSGPAAAGEPLDRPVVWFEDDRRPIPEVEERAPRLVETGLKDGFFRPVDRFMYPGRWFRQIGVLFGGDHVMPAANINALDEVPNSTWFTNRLGLYPLSPTECANGPGGDGPDRGERWRVIGAKVGGVTPGFRIRDARGEVYLLKFDPPGWPGQTIGAGVIANRILWAAGYNVPQDEAITFELEDVLIEPGVALRLPGGGELSLTPARLDSIMSALQPDANGTWRVLSSKFLSGKPVGPFDYQGRRKDDPNDRVKHEQRRELRGLRMFAAWINHFDTKQENSLDVFVETAPGRGFVQHYLIDFASTVGAGGQGPTRKWGREYAADGQALFGNLLTLGLHESPWRRLQLPADMPEIGFLESDSFEPQDFKPMLSNTAFSHMTDDDGYWAAKIISAFRDEHLEAIVHEARYGQPKAADFLVRTLSVRRDIIARYFFDRIAPLEFFVVQADRLVWHDLGVERRVYPEGKTRYQYRCAPSKVDRGAGPWSSWQDTDSTEISTTTGAFARAQEAAASATHPFVAVDCRVDRGRGWQDAVRVFVERGTDRVAALER